MIRVSDIMSTELLMVDGRATVEEAMKQLARAGISSLVVNRQDNTDEFGLVVISDIAAEVIVRNRAPESVLVHEIMTRPVLTLPSDMQVHLAIRLLTRFEVSRAVVIDHDRNPVGLATLRDLVLASVTA